MRISARHPRSARASADRDHGRGPGVGLALALLTAVSCSEPPPPTEGQPCDYSDRRCTGGLVCFAARCRTKAQVEKELNAAAQLDRRDDERRAEPSPARSGGEQPLPAEPPAPASQRIVAGRGVRVARTSGKGPLFAACRADEQLIGGGCQVTSLDAALSASYPSQHARGNTRGSRWNCDVASDHRARPLQAYALCQPLPPDLPAKRTARARRRGPPRLIEVIAP